MGSLTEDMTHLVDEILASRGARLTFIQDLGQNVAEIKANLHLGHAEMARQTTAERQGFVKALGREVESLRTGFRQAHQEMAKKTKAKRLAAVNDLKICVGGMCRDFSLDLAGARRAWSGPTPAERRAKAEAERRAKTEAERRAREGAERERQAAEARTREEAARTPAGHQPKEEANRHGKKKG